MISFTTIDYPFTYNSQVYNFLPYNGRYTVYQYLNQLFEVLSISDEFSRTVQFHRSFSDAFGLLDEISKGADKFQDETVGVFDSVTKGADKFVEENVSILDSFSRVVNFIRSFSETASTVDDIFKTIGKNTSESFGIQDDFSRVVQFFRTFFENLTVTDLINAVITQQVLNQFMCILKGIQAAMVNGFIDAGNLYFRNTSPGTLRVKNMDGNDTEMSVEFDKKNLKGNNWLGPYIYIHPFALDLFNLLGGYKREHTIQIFLVFNQEHYWNVDGKDIAEDELARYFLDVLIDGFNHLSGQFMCQKNPKIKEVPGFTQTGIIDENTNMYGVTIRYRITF